MRPSPCADYPRSFALLPEDRVVIAGSPTRPGSRGRANVVIRFVAYGQAEARLHFEDGRLFAAGMFAGPGEAFPRAFCRL